jgi:hypothetical protein
MICKIQVVSPIIGEDGLEETRKQHLRKPGAGQ